MKISPININTYTKQIKTQEKETTTNKYISQNLYVPSLYSLSFCGGKSMDLKQTMLALKDEDYPKNSGGIKALIEKTLAEGNPENKTLIDIHREYYKELKHCNTLDEAKKAYPEFKDVIAENECDTKFIKEVKNGSVRGFDRDKDVSLQLLQLYWGEGFSLDTLRKNYADKDFLGTFRTLNIPRTTNQYGLYLKLSDKNYNARYTQAISERIKDIERKHIEAHRNYYTGNPEKLHEMTNEDRKFFKEHPKEKDIMSIVMLRAWKYPEAQIIRQSMSETLLKATSNKEAFEESLEPLSPVNKAFKLFWLDNDWAKSILSVCIRKSWYEQNGNKQDTNIKSVNYVPTQVRGKIIAYANDKHLNIDKYIDIPLTDNEAPDSKDIFLAKEIGNEFFNKNPKESTNVMYSRLYGIINAFLNFSTANIKTKGKFYSDLPEMIKIFENNVINKQDEELKDSDIYTLYRDLMIYCAENNQAAMLEINKNIDRTYNIVSGMNQDEIMSYGELLTKDLIDFLPDIYT